MAGVAWLLCLYRRISWSLADHAGNQTKNNVSGNLLYFGRFPDQPLLKTALGTL